MARLSSEINLNTLPEDDYAPLKEGVYTAIITKTSVEANRNNTGEFIKLELTVLGPTNKGAKLFHRINYKHTNPDTQRIAQVELRQILEATGVTRMADTDELCNIPLNVKVTVQEAHDGYEASNNIKRFSKASSSQAPADYTPAQTYAAPTSAPTPDAGVQKPAKKPWEH